MFSFDLISITSISALFASLPMQIHNIQYTWVTEATNIHHLKNLMLYL